VIVCHFLGELLVLGVGDVTSEGDETCCDSEEVLKSAGDDNIFHHLSSWFAFSMLFTGY